MGRRRYVVCYDIASPVRWRQVYKIMQGHSEWIPLSVFLCDLDDVERVRLQDLLDAQIHHREDSVCFADLGAVGSRGASSVEFMGRSRGMPQSGPVIF